MSPIPIYQVDAFADALFQGNPAAVCPLERWLPDELLQHIAAENQLSETAFFVPRGDGFELRWFTPAAEVDLCGHATLACAHVVFEILGWPATEIAFDSRSGRLVVRRVADSLTLDFPSVPAEPVDDGGSLWVRIEGALGRRPAELYAAPRDFLAVFEDAAQITALEPDFRALAAIEERPGWIVTAPAGAGERPFDFLSRFFAPSYGVDEDPVTGSAHCTLAPFWSERLGRNPLRGYQASARGGEVICEVRGDRVLLTGRAVLYLEGVICV